MNRQRRTLKLITAGLLLSFSLSFVQPVLTVVGANYDLLAGKISNNT